MTARIASDVARIAHGVTGIARIALSGEESVEELLHFVAGLVEQASELLAAAGVARIAVDVATAARIAATDFVARTAAGIATVARAAIGIATAARITATDAALSEREAFEKFLEPELRAATGVAADFAARIAVDFTAAARIAFDHAARITIDIARSAGITAVHGKKLLQLPSERELMTTAGITTDAGITFDDVAAGHDTVTGATFRHRARLAGDQTFQT